MADSYLNIRELLVNGKYLELVCVPVIRLTSIALFLPLADDNKRRVGVNITV